jgi:hypothetical protein
MAKGVVAFFFFVGFFVYILMCGAYTAVEQVIRVHNSSVQVRLAEYNFDTISACLPGLKAYAQSRRPIAGISDAPLDHVDTDPDVMIAECAVAYQIL